VGLDMPRKRRKFVVSQCHVPLVDPADRRTASDADLVRHALVDFEELEVLPPPAHEQLIQDLVNAVRFARAGVKVRKKGVSDAKVAQQIFAADIAQAMRRAGLSTARWRKQYDNGGNESLYFRVLREIAEVSGLPAIPTDPKLLGQRAEKFQYL
jgi:alkylation response protein AidB-like acyl-CoA dehydrogenase